MLISYKNKTPRVDDGCFVAENAAVAGDVTLAAGASVWFGAVIRADLDTIVIGEDTNIQDNATLHCDAGFPMRLGRGVTVGHNAVVHGAVVEDDVLIGMGAVVLNGARIGAHSVIGAGAVVKAGMEIPAYSLVVGIPGRITKTLTAEQTAGNRENAEHYCALARAYLEEQRK